MCIGRGTAWEVSYKVFQKCCATAGLYQLVRAHCAYLLHSLCWTSYGLKSFMVGEFTPQIINRYCKSRWFFWLFVFCLFWRASWGNHFQAHHYLSTSKSQLCSSSVPRFILTTLMPLFYSPWSPQGRPTGVCLFPFISPIDRTTELLTYIHT